MKRIGVGITILLLVIQLIGCAGRKPDPVAVYRANDIQLSCDDLKTEFFINQKTALKLAKKRGHTGSNTGIAIVGALLFWPALFALNFSKADQIELKAYHARDKRLLVLMKKKRCKGYGI